MTEPIVLYGVRWGTAELVNDRLGADVTPPVLEQWKRRGLIRGVVIGRGPTRQAVYRLDDCEEAEMLTRTSGRGRPRKAA